MPDTRALTDALSKATVAAYGVVKFAESGEATAGEAVQSTDTRLSDSRTPDGTAGGVLSGTYPNPDFATPMATAASVTAVATNLAEHVAVMATSGVAGHVTLETMQDLVAAMFPQAEFAYDDATGIIAVTFPEGGGGTGITDGYLDWPEQGTPPATPADLTRRMYANSDGIALLDEGGVPSQVALLGRADIQRWVGPQRFDGYINIGEDTPAIPAPIYISPAPVANTNFAAVRIRNPTAAVTDSGGTIEYQAENDVGGIQHFGIAANGATAYSSPIPGMAFMRGSSAARGLMTSLGNSGALAVWMAATIESMRLGSSFSNGNASKSPGFMIGAKRQSGKLTIGPGTAQLTGSSTVYDEPDIALVLGPPQALTGNPVAGGTNAEGAHYYRVTSVDADGNETLASHQRTVTFTSTNKQVTIAWAAVTGAAAYRVYRSTTSFDYTTNPSYLGQTAALTFLDDGSITPTNQAPPSEFQFTSLSASVVAGGSLPDPVRHYYTVVGVAWQKDSQFVSAEVSAQTTAVNKTTQLAIGAGFNATSGSTFRSVRIYRTTTAGVYGATSLLYSGPLTSSIYLDDGTVALTTGAPPSTGAGSAIQTRLAGVADSYLAYSRLALGHKLPTAKLHVAGSAAGAAGTAAAKLGSGTLLATPEAGAIEYDGTNLYITGADGIRQTVALLGRAVTFTAAVTFQGTASALFDITGAPTNAAHSAMVYRAHTSGGTPAIGLGVLLRFQADTNGGSNQNLATVTARWADVTDATRRAYMEFRLYNVAATPVPLRLDATNNGSVSVGGAAPSARLELPAGAAAAGSGPLKLVAGVNLTTPEAGVLEYDGTNLYFTPTAGNRRTVQLSSAATPRIYAWYDKDNPAVDSIYGPVYTTDVATTYVGIVGDTQTPPTGSAAVATIRYKVPAGAWADLVTATFAVAGETPTGGVPAATTFAAGTKFMRKWTTPGNVAQATVQLNLQVS